MNGFFILSLMGDGLMLIFSWYRYLFGNRIIYVNTSCTTICGYCNAIKSNNPKRAAPIIIDQEIQSLNSLFLWRRKSRCSNRCTIRKMSKPFMKVSGSWLWVSSQKIQKNRGKWAHIKTINPRRSFNRESPGKIRHSLQRIASISWRKINDIPM